MTKHADRDHSEPYWPPAARAAYGCTCAVKSNTAHVCAEMPQTVWLDDAEIKAAVARHLDAHPEEKVDLDRLVRGDLVRSFPLDDGDTGAAMLPVAPAGTLLRCPVCPAALADTRGGRLDHCDDGSHHYVPEADAEAAAERRRRYATALDLHSFALASRYWQRFVLRVMAVADDELADQAKTRASGHERQIIDLRRALADERATSHSLREGVIKQLGEMLTDERATVARVEDLAAYLETLAPGDRHYAARIRAALAGTP